MPQCRCWEQSESFCPLCSSDNFQDQMKRELSYREEMVQQLQIVRGWSLSKLCAFVDSDWKADVDQCSLSLWGKNNRKQKRLNNIDSLNQSDPNLQTRQERKSDTCILQYWQFVSSLFPVNSTFFFLLQLK